MKRSTLICILTDVHLWVPVGRVDSGNHTSDDPEVNA